MIIITIIITTSRSIPHRISIPTMSPFHNPVSIYIIGCIPVSLLFLFASPSPLIPIPMCISITSSIHGPISISITPFNLQNVALSPPMGY